jgi:hypothetical protein
MGFGLEDRNWGKGADELYLIATDELSLIKPEKSFLEKVKHFESVLMIWS